MSDSPFNSCRYLRTGTRLALRQHPTILARRSRARDSDSPVSCSENLGFAPFACCASSKLREGAPGSQAPGGCASFALEPKKCCNFWLEWDGAWAYDEFPCGYRSLVVNSGSSDWISIFEREQCERHKRCKAPDNASTPPTPTVPPKDLGETLVAFEEKPCEDGHAGPHAGYTCCVEGCGADSATWSAAFEHATGHVAATEAERGELFAHCISSSESYMFRLLSHAWHQLPEQLYGEDAVIMPVASLPRFADWIHAGLCMLPLDTSPVIDIIYGPNEQPVWFEWVL